MSASGDHIFHFPPRLTPAIALIHIMTSVKILSIGTGKSEQTVQTQIRLLLMEQSDLGLHCLLFHLHLLDAILQGVSKNVDLFLN